MQLYKDDHGTPCATAEGDFAMLASFLESDVQSNKDHALALLTAMEKKMGTYTGNGYSITFSDQDVLISELFGEENEQSYDRNIFFQAIEAWMVFIAS